MNMQNIKALKWGISASLLLSATFILCLEVVVGKKSANVSNKVEQSKPLVEPTTQMPLVVETPSPTKVTPLQIQETTSVFPTHEPTPTVGNTLPPVRHTNRTHHHHLSSKISQTSLKNPHPSPDQLSEPKPKRPHPKQNISIITIHPYSHNSNKMSNSPHLPHTWKGRQLNNSTDNQLVNSTELVDKPAHHLSTPPPNHIVSKLKSTPLSQPKTSKVSKVSSPSQILKDNHFVNSTKSRDKPGLHSTTHSPVTLKSKPKSTSRSRQQKSQVNKLSSPVIKVAKFYNATSKPGRSPYHPSPASKLKSDPPLGTQALQVSKLSSPALTVNEIINSTGLGDKTGSNPSTPLSASKVSKIKSTSLSQLKASQVSEVSNPSHPSSSSQISHKSKSKPVSTHRPQTSKVGKVSRPALKDNQFVNLAESGDKQLHHTSTPSPVHHNSITKSASPPVPKTLQATTVSTPTLTDNQFINSTKSAKSPSTPSPESNVSKLESVPSSPINLVNTMQNPVLKDAQLFNSTKSAHKKHRPHNGTRRSHASKLKSTSSSSPQTEVSPFFNTSDKPVHHPSTPAPDSQDSVLKSTSLLQPQTSQVSSASTPVTDSQTVNSTKPRDKLSHHTSTPSPLSHVSKLKSTPPPTQQTLQIRKVSSPISTDNQFANSSKSEDKPIPQNYSLKLVHPSPQQALQVSNVTNPLLTDEQLVNSRVSRNQPGYHPHKSSRVHHNLKLKSAYSPDQQDHHHAYNAPLPPKNSNLKLASPSQTQTIQVHKVSSSVLTDNQAHSFQVHKVSSPDPVVKDILFLTSTESGDKAAHFKVTFR